MNALSRQTICLMQSQGFFGQTAGVRRQVYEGGEGLEMAHQDE